MTNFIDLYELAVRVSMHWDNCGNWERSGAESEIL